MNKTKRQSYNAGKLLIKENEFSRRLYVIKQGQVRIFKTYLGGKVSLAILGPGEIFGELSFFDAEARSASAEALTDIVVECLDGDQLHDEIESLPKWVHLIFRTVAERFRNIDQKMTVLESMDHFQRKALSISSIGNSIYLELIRYLKILNLHIQSQGNEFEKESLITELSSSIGKCFITPKAFIKSLLRHNFISNDHYNKTKKYRILSNDIRELEAFLKSEYESDKCTLLTNYDLATMRTILTQTSFVNANQSNRIALHINDINPYDEDETNKALKNLVKHKLLALDEDMVVLKIDDFARLFRFYSVVKTFDHTIIYEN